MTRSISLHVGINEYDPSRYDPIRFGRLRGCENDALLMCRIAESKGFEHRTLLRGEQASFDEVINRIQGAAKDLKAGGIFLFTFAGHGSFRDDRSDDETDDKDESLLLYDFELFDDRIHRHWACFDKDVRILMVSDTCHSGTSAQVTSAGVRTIPYSAMIEHRRRFRDFYDGLSEPCPSDKEVRASVLLLAACEDDERATEDEDADGQFYGRFTRALRDVCNGGRFSDDYDGFIKEISNTVRSPTQHPMIYPLGKDTAKFRKQSPFSV